CPRIRSVRHAHPQTGLGVEARIVQAPLAGRAAAPADVITVDMGIAESAEVDAGALDAQARLGVVEEMPAPTDFCRLRGRTFESADERLDVEIGFDPVLDLGRRAQIRRRMLRLRGEEVVGPEDEDTG